MTRLSGAAFTAGIDTSVLDGARVRVYSLAKSITDCFKLLRRKAVLNVALKAPLEAFKQCKVSMDELRFAKVNRMANVMRPRLEKPSRAGPMNSTRLARAAVATASGGWSDATQTCADPLGRIGGFNRRQPRACRADCTAATQYLTIWQRTWQ